MSVINLAWLIIVFPALGTLFNALFSARLPQKVASTVAIAASGLAFIMSAIVFAALLGLPADQRTVDVPLYQWASVDKFQLTAGLFIDPLSAVMLIVVTFVGTLIHIYSIGYMSGDSRYRRFFVYLNLFLTSMLILVLGDSYVMMFVGWEGVGLCSYLLIGFWFEKEANANAATKAFIANRVGDFGFMLAMLAIFWTAGSLQYPDVFAKAESGAMTAAATAITLLMFLGATGKSAQIPLYVWLPDAMAGPTPVSALIHAATMVTAGIYMIARNHALFALAPTSQAVVAIVGSVTAIFAATIAVAQFDIKKVLAYSTISQLGFMISAVGMGATVAGIFHLGTHAFFKALLFLGAGSVIHAMEHAHHEMEHAGHPTQANPPRGKGKRKQPGVQTPQRDEAETGAEEKAPFDPNDMRGMGGLQTRMPWTFATYLVGALALAGIPPLAGFWSKDEILTDAFTRGFGGGNPAYQIAFVLLLLAAFFTAFYMTRQVLMVFRGGPRTEAAARAPESPHVMTYVLAVLAVFAALVGFVNVGGALTAWLEPKEHFEGLNLGMALTSTLVALAGVGLGYLVYRPEAAPAGVDDPLRKPPVIGWIFSNVLLPKYKVDELYNLLFVDRFRDLACFLADTVEWRVYHDWFHDTIIAGGFKALSSFLTRPVESNIIDGAVNGTGALVEWAAIRLRRIQTGYVRNYALSVLLGVVIIVAYFVLR